MTHEEVLKRALKELIQARINLDHGQKNGVPPDQLAALREKVEYRETVVEVLRPAHIDREAWEPCGELCRNNCMTCDHNADEVFGDADYCEDCHRYSKWESAVNNFCNRCGRPKTQKAWAMLEKRLRG